MTVTLDNHIVRYTTTESEAFTWAGMEAWLIANCTGEMTTLPGPGMYQVDIVFDNEADALLWMLSWGGEYLRPYKSDIGVTW